MLQCLSKETYSQSFLEDKGGEGYYTTRERFIRALHADYYLPIERFHDSTEFIVNAGGYIEPSWYRHQAPSRYFTTYGELMYPAV